MQKYYEQLLGRYFLFFFLFYSTIRTNAQVIVKPAQDNFTYFTPDENYADAEKLAVVNPATMRNHPDYGKCFTDNPNWVEQLDKRTLKSRSYVGDNGQVITQYGYDNINYLDNNGWLRAVDTKLKPIENGWAVTQQENAAYLYTDASTALNIGNGQLITFNKNVQFNLAAINTTTKTVGDNGMMIKDVATNTDKIIRFKRNTVETDYLINKPLNISGDLIISEDVILPAGYTLSQAAELSDENEAGSLAVIGPDGKEKAVLKVPACYDKGRNEIIGSYRIQKQAGGYRLEIDVPSSWINNSERKYPVTIDPVITGATTTWSGGKIASCIYPSFGSGTMAITIPADVTVTSFYIQSSYYANPLTSETLDEGLVYFGSRCGSTGLSSINPPQGDSSGTGVLPLTDFHSSLACCINPSCSAQTVNLTMYISRLSGGSLCDSQYIYYDPANTGGSPFEAYVVGNTVELNNSQWSLSPLLLCGNDCSLTISGTINYGVPPYTISHSWAGSSVMVGKYDTSVCTSTGAFTLTITIPSCPSSSCVQTLLSVPPPVITDACGTTVQGLTFKLATVKPVPTVTASADSQKVCSGSPFDISLTSCVTGTTFTWSGSDGSSGTGSPIVDSAINNSSTAHTVTFTITPSANGCTGNPVTVVVIVEPIPTSTFTASPLIVCANGKLAVNYTGVKISGAVYNWNFGGGTLLSGSPTGPGPDTISFASSGSHVISLTVTANGCTSTLTSVTVTVNANPVITATPSPVSYCPGGSSKLTASGGITYTWSPSTSLSATTGSSVIANPAVTTTYTVTGTNSSGCSATATVVVTVNPNPIIIANPSPASYCPGGSSTITASGGTTYTWSPSTSLSATTGSSIIANPTVTTTYTVTGTNSNGCTSTTTVVVTVNPKAVITATPSPASYCVGGSSTLTASGGTTYTWSPSTSLSATTGSSVITNPTVTTTYTVTGTNSSGCSATATVVVTVNPKPVITATPSPASYCPGGSSTLTASGGTTYTWSPSTSLSVTTGSSVTANPTVTTTYTVTGTNSNGCTATATVVVTVNPKPVITATPSPASYCPGGSSTLTASGGTTYTWSPSTSLGATTGSSVIANPTVTTTYTVTGTNSNGCTSTSTVVVTVNPKAVISANPSPASYCPGGSSTLTASGGTTYTWSPSTSLSATTGSSVIANPTVTTTYTVTGTNSSGCSATTTVVITVNPIPIITATPSPASYCPGGSSKITASGGTTYTWSPSTSLSATTGSSVTANPTVTTTYTVTGTNSSGCSSTTTVVITVNPNPIITVIPSPVSYCPGGSSTITASGGTTYTWSPSTSLSATTGSSVTANPTVTTTYTVTGTNSNGCTSTTTVVITVNPKAVIIATPTPASYCPGGSSTLTASGGTTYTWSPSTSLSATTGSSVTANPTVTKTYTVTGTNASGCSATATVIVTVNSNPIINILPNPATICSGASVMLAASGATTYTWSPASGLSGTTGSSVTANPTVTTTYTVMGTSLSGCTSTITDVVTVNPKPIITAIPSPASYCPGGSSTLTASGGTTYTWSPSTSLSATTGSSVIANPATTTTYTVTGTNSNGCTSTTTVVVIVNPKAVISANPSPASYCPGGSSTLTASGGTTYTWSPSTSLSATTGSSVTANPTVTTTYTVTGTNSSGCSATATVVVTVNTNPVINITPNPATICNGVSTGLTASGGTTYTWSPSTGLSATTGSSVMANPTITTTYTITGTNSNGCTSTTTDVVMVNSNPVITATPSPASYCPGGSSTLTASGGTTYTWSPSTSLSATTGSSVTANPTITTTYTVTGINSGGCSSTTTVVVTVNPKTIISANPSPASYCPGGSSTLTASGGTTYTWSPSTGLSATTGSSVTANPTVTTTYTVTGTNSSGCSATATVVVTVNPNPVININPSPATICNGAAAILSASGATTYTWSPAIGLSATAGSSVTANPTIATTYTITGTNSNGCTSITTVVVMVNSNPVITATPSPASYCPGGSSTITASGGTTYTWSPSTGLSATTGSSVTANPTVTTTYTVTGTNSNGCTSTTTVVVTVNPKAVITATPSPASYCPGGSSTLTASGGTTYTWSPSTGLSATNGSSVTANPTVTTTYTVSGTNSNGCSATTTVVVTVNPNPIINVSPNPTTICSGTSAMLSASGATTYTWSPATGLSSTSGSSVSVTDTSTTVYSITGTNSNGCVTTITDTVKVNANPSISAAVSRALICTDSSAVLTAFGGSIYTWSPSTGLSATSGSSVIATPTITTVYIVTGSNLNGCVDTASVRVTVVPKLSITVTPKNPYYCIGGNATLTASGVNNYTWTPSSGLSSTSGSSVIASPTITSTYTVSGTDSIGCFASATFTLTVDPNPKGTVTPNPVTICAGVGAKLTTSGASFYFWFPAAGLSSSMGSSVVATPTIATTYTVIGVDSNGCKDTVKVGVSVNPDPTVTAVPSTSNICNTDSVDLTANGGKTYTWSPSSGLSTTSGSSIIAIPSKTTRYIVTGTDTNGCSDTSSVLVTIVPGPQLTVSPPNPDICIGSNVTLVVSGALTYTWSPSIGLSCTTCSNPVANPTVTSTYIVKSTNTQCPGYDTITVKVDTIPTLSISKDTLICQLTPVQLNAKTSGTITWSPSIGLSCTTCDSTIANPNSTITYTALAQNGACSVSDSVTISVDIFTFSVCPDQHVLYGVTAQLSASGAIHYSWTPANSLSNNTIINPIADPTVTTTYYVTGTDSLGCGGIDSVIVFVGDPCQLIQIPNAFTPNGDGVNDYFHVLSHGDISLSVFEVYNRWGKKVYQTSNINDKGWDGTYNGKPQPIGTYVYYAEIICEDRTILLRGSVTLIR